MTLNFCCCCAPLRSGTLAIAITYVVVNVAGLLGWSIFLVVDLLGNDVANGAYSRKSYIVLHVYILLGVLVLTSLCIATNSLLIVGIRRNQRKYFLPWIVWYTIFSIILTVGWMMAGGYLIHGMIWSSGTEGYGIYLAFFCAFIVPFVIVFAVMWYWYACVVSYYILLAPSDSYVMEPLREEAVA